MKEFNWFENDETIIFPEPRSEKEIILQNLKELDERCDKGGVPGSLEDRTLKALRKKLNRRLKELNRGE